MAGAPMTPDAPKTIAETRARMNDAVRSFRSRAIEVGPEARVNLEEQTRRAIERLRKQFRHKIDDQLRRDAKRHRGINEGERLGLENQLRSAVEGALTGLENAVAALTAAPEPPD